MMEWRLLYVPKASIAEGISSNLRSESAIVCGILCIAWYTVCDCNSALLSWYGVFVCRTIGCKKSSSSVM